MKLYEPDEIDLMMDAANRQECKDAESLAAANRMLAILDGLIVDIAKYEVALETAHRIVNLKIKQYEESKTWDNL